MIHRLTLFLFAIVFAYGKISAQQIASNPVKNISLKNSILFQPQEFIEDERNVSSLFLTAKEGTPIVAPTNGKVHSFRMNYLFSLTYSKGGNLNQEESYDSQKKSFLKALKNAVNPKYINASISVISDDGVKYHMKGIVPKTIPHSGLEIKQGQILGYMGFAYHKIAEPSIMFSASKNSKSVDPLSLFGLKSSFVETDSFKYYATRKYEPIKLKEALSIVRESLEEGHPGLYDYSSESKIDSIFNSISQKLKVSKTAEELRELFTPLLVTVGDNHLRIYGQERKNMPPFPSVLFGLENEKVKIINAFKENESFLNKEVVQINGEDVKSVIVKLKQNIPGADGGIKSIINENLLLNMAPLYCTVYGINSGDSISLKFNDNTVSKFHCKQLGRNDRYFPMFNYKRENYRVKTSFISKDIALLRIKTFNLYGTDKDSIENFIRELDGTNCQNLIIDIRGNKGGEGYKLFGMFIKEPYKSVLYSKVNKQYYKFFKHSYNYVPDMGLFNNYILNKGNYYNYSNSLSPSNDSIHFSGNLYVLTNANSNSESARFAGLVHKYNRGVIIGQETGTTYHQMNAVKFASVNVANTGLTMRMPLVKVVFHEPGNSDIPFGRGVIPDYPIELKLEDYFSNNDQIMNFTLELIKNKKTD